MKVFNISIACAGAVLLSGALVYFNVIDNKKQEQPKESLYHIYQVGDECPDFEYQIYNSSETFKASNYRGKILIINFWGTWCTPCIQELPWLQKVDDNYEDVEVIALHSTVIDSSVNEYINTYLSSYTFQFAQDVKDKESGMSFFDCLGGTDYMPYTVILDREGKIDSMHNEAITSEPAYNVFNSEIGELVERTK